MNGHLRSAKSPIARSSASSLVAVAASTSRSGASSSASDQTSSVGQRVDPAATAAQRLRPAPGRTGCRSAGCAMASAPESPCVAQVHLARSRPAGPRGSRSGISAPRRPCRQPAAVPPFEGSTRRASPHAPSSPMCSAIRPADRQCEWISAAIRVRGVSRRVSSSRARSGSGRSEPGTTQQVAPGRAGRTSRAGSCHAASRGRRRTSG